MVILILALVASGIYIWKDKQDSKHNEWLRRVSEQFYRQYGANAQVITTEKPNILATYWKDDTYFHISIELGNMWVEVYRQPLNTDNTTEGQ